MGILDDAIREHLDLKRRLGAADSEIQRLEDEAFGPPTRPGEPDFPETGEEQVGPAEEQVGPVEDMGAAPEPVDPSEALVFDHDETGHGAEEPIAEPSVADEAPAEPSLDIDDPAAHLEVLSEPAGAPEPEPEPQPPIESLDTVEHPFEGALEDTGGSEAVAPEPSEPPQETGEQPLDTGEQPAAGEEEGEDVLEETPEFLREQPEDDELWFEQGEPKDFDF